MAIQIGAKPENDFHRPLGLMSDCHRRIERFLDGAIAICDSCHGERLGAQDAETLATALRYFRAGIPLHTADEEESLFPRLHEIETEEVRALFSNIDDLEREHEGAALAHAEVDDLGEKWLRDGGLTAQEFTTLADLLHALRSVYRRHIAFEDGTLFPTAQRALSSSEIEHIGREMARRRGLDPDNLPEAPRCVGRRVAEAA